MNTRAFLHLPVLAFLVFTVAVVTTAFEFLALDRMLIQQISLWLGLVLGSAVFALLIAGLIFVPVLSSRYGISRPWKYALAGVSGVPTIFAALLGVLILQWFEIEIHSSGTLLLMTALLTPRALQLYELAVPRTLRRYREATLALGGSPRQFSAIWLFGGSKLEWLRRLLKLSVIGFAEASALLVLLSFAKEAEARSFLRLLNEDFMRTAPWLAVICAIFHVTHQALEEK